MTRMLVGWNDEYDDYYVVEAGELEETDIETARFGRLGGSPAFSELVWHVDDETAARKEITALADCDDAGRTKEPCAAWVGETSPGRTWWEIVLPESGDENTWPLRPVTIALLETEAEAVAAVAGLPERFYMHASHTHFREIDRSTLLVGRNGYRASDGPCTTCGHTRSEHAS